MKMHNVMGSEEAFLWKRVCAGEKEALEFIYRKYYVSLLNYGRKFDVSEELIEDCIHDIFIDIFHNTKIKDTQNIEFYLIRSLRNRIINYFLSKKNFLEINDVFNFSIEDTAIQNLFSEDDKDVLMMHKLKLAYLKLPPNQKEAIYLKFFKDFSYKQISEIMNINYQSAKNLVYRGMVLLRGSM